MVKGNATVIKSTGSFYTLQTDGGEKRMGRLRGKFKLTLASKRITNPVAVGDRVLWVEDDANAETVIITGIEDRKNYLVRQSVHKTAHAHLLASNLDRVMLICTLAQPRTSLGFIDRFLVSAEAFRIPATLVLNKLDLLSGEDQEAVTYLEKLYTGLGYGFLGTSVVDNVGIEELKEVLSDSTTLISGHSGVGKSSLANALLPGLNLRTKEISTFANKGVHTTTFAERFELWPGAYIIDTPGIKELGLAEIGAEELGHYFPELRDLLNKCRFHNCRHLDEPDCAVKDGVKAGRVALSRYESYLSMMAGGDNRK